MNPSTKHLPFDLPGRYRIRVQGRLEPDWSSRLSDMAISARQAPGGQPVTMLTGELLDQTALMGVLSALYAMGFTLLKVERLGSLLSTDGPISKGEESIQRMPDE